MVPGDTFRRLLRDEPSVLRGALGVIVPVAQGAEAAARGAEKLIALGTLSAGLAHELNNPAVSARRSASDLAEALEVIHGTVARVVAARVEREGAAERIVENHHGQVRLIFVPGDTTFQVRSPLPMG